jgi:hypothetical protein
MHLPMTNAQNIQQFEFEAFPRTNKFLKQVASELEKMDAFVADGKTYDGLYPPAAAARLVNVSQQRIDQLVVAGKFNVCEHFDKKWLRGCELKQFIFTERKAGRPWKIPSGAGLIVDTVKGCSTK